MEPAEKPAQANTAAEVREAFFKAAGGAVQSRDVRLKLARKGFHETTRAVRSGIKKPQSEFTHMLSGTTVSASYSCEVVMHEG